MALGETGIGKSTLMDTLFNTNFENFESSHFEPEVKLRAQTYDLQESNVRLRLTVVNTVGFGDQMNKQERWEEACACLLQTLKNSDRLRVFESFYTFKFSQISFIKKKTKHVASVSFYHSSN